MYETLINIERYGKILKFGRYCKLMLPCQKAGVYRLENGH